ncbi:hypothetical protein EV586_101721 [Tumebacillus sp. BK434]|uniref:hypothetical protein n=1 Tax=Tumebacillus sp. BK434 TaxID=2512169 RepID=UPI0010EF4974|nr:hypothetical protein [Tumebacillus sp. BK434]TCP59502.1 hypothetical protein EV586_101721 [Tumebacillus sp. BK434]
MKKFALVLSIASALFLALSLLHTAPAMADDPPIWEGCTKSGVLPSACVQAP